jgi:dipeptidyl aminopeptidase/acylaminoacyl peptidase
MPTFLADGQPVNIDEYSPADERRHPAVLLVHGAAGPLTGLDPYAEKAAQFGVNVFVVHYFEKTGHTFVDDATIERCFLEWLESLRAAVDYVAAHPRVDASRIGMLGFSLGSYLSLGLATQDQRIRCVAEFFGGFPHYQEFDPAKLPPVLILHGKDDPRVPVAEALKLEQLCKQHNIPYDIKLYRGQGHSLKGLAQMDALRRIVAFFKQNFAARAA